MAQVSTQFSGTASDLSDVFELGHSTWLPAARHPRGVAGSVTSYVINQVVVLDSTQRLIDVVEELDVAISRALSDEPRGVVCDLSNVRGWGAAGVVRLLASAGRHPRDWPATPVVVACRDPQLRDALSARPLGGRLGRTDSRRQAFSTVLHTSPPSVSALVLEPHPTAARAARDFVSRALLDEHLAARIPAARLVVSELVTNAMVHAGTYIDLSIAVHDGAVRLTVRDRCPDPPVRRASPSRHGGGLAAVEHLSRAWGVLPTAEGGKAVWAVLAARPGPGGPR